MDLTLGQTIPEMTVSLDRLIGATTDNGALAKLAPLKRRLHTQLEHLIDQNLDQADQAYKNAVAGVQAATRATREALQDHGRMGEAISALTKAVGLISKIIRLPP
jgi:paraquat-inducible protein B